MELRVVGGETLFLHKIASNANIGINYYLRRWTIDNSSISFNKWNGEKIPKKDYSK